MLHAGHSLGAAVAALSTLRLLQQLPAGAQPAISCLTFACPAVGNAALADEVAARGWSPFFKNLLIPGEAGFSLQAALPEFVGTNGAWC